MATQLGLNIGYILDDNEIYVIDGYSFDFKCVHVIVFFFFFFYSGALQNKDICDFFFLSTRLCPSKYLIKALELEGCISIVPSLKCLRRVYTAG